MKSNRRSLLIAIAVLLGASALYSQLDHATVIMHRVRILAGSGAINCGHIKPQSDPKPASECVLTSFGNHKPFYVLYDTQEFAIDSHFIDGLAGDKSGNVYDVEFSSRGWASEGLPAGAQLFDGKHIFVEACKKPVALNKSVYQGLTCIPRITDRPRETDEKSPSTSNSTWRFAESGVSASYFGAGAGAGWFSLVGGTIPLSRK